MLTFAGDFIRFAEGKLNAYCVELDALVSNDGGVFTVGDT